MLQWQLLAASQRSISFRLFSTPHAADVHSPQTYLKLTAQHSAALNWICFSRRSLQLHWPSHVSTSDREGFSPQPGVSQLSQLYEYGKTRQHLFAAVKSYPLLHSAQFASSVMVPRHHSVSQEFQIPPHSVCAPFSVYPGGHPSSPNNSQSQSVPLMRCTLEA